MSVAKDQMIIASASGSAAAAAPQGFTPVFSAQVKSKIEKDFLLSFDDLKRRAEANDASAQLHVGISLSFGWMGCLNNMNEGNKWIELAAKNENSPAGMCAKGLCFKRGIGGQIIKNNEKAKECFIDAIKQGYLPATYELAAILYGEALTTTESMANYERVTHTHKDNAKLEVVISLLLPGAEAGYAPSIEWLASCYRSGNGVNRDYKEALKLYHIAAEKGNCWAKRWVGIMNEYGWGVEANRSEARKWYEAAAAQGLNCDADLARTSCCTIM